MKVLAATPETMGPDQIGAHAARAERLGFDGLLVPDAIHDGLLLAALALNATERLEVTTGVLVAFPRSPMTTAVAAWDLQKLSGGRFQLGLGTQIRQNIEQRYSAQWGSPVPHMREYVQSLQAIFRAFQLGERLDFQGEYYQFSRLQPFFNPGPLDCGPPPVLCGAVGPAMTRMVGRVADGLITHPTSSAPAFLEQVCRPRIEEGMQKAGRDWTGFQTILSPLVATGRDERALQAEREKQRRLLGFLYSTPAYWPSLELFGWRERGEQLQSLTREGRWQDLADIVTDEMLETFVSVGRYAEIAGIINERYRGLGDALIFPLPEAAGDEAQLSEVLAAIQSASPAAGPGASPAVPS